MLCGATEECIGEGHDQKIRKHHFNVDPDVDLARADGEIHGRGDLRSPRKKTGKYDGLGQREAVEKGGQLAINPQKRGGVDESCGRVRWGGRRD